jgi:GDP-L-fucose synthase
VLPALIRKAHEAKLRGDSALVVWGTGKPMREFLYSDDMARACVFLLQSPEERFRELTAAGAFPLVNIGAGKDLSIRELAELVCEVVGFRGQLEFDTTKPDGTPRKLMDSGKLQRLGWRAQIGLREGIGMAYAEYLKTVGEAATGKAVGAAG